MRAGGIGHSLTGLLFLVLSQSRANAQTVSWTGAVNAQWSVGGNWSGGSVPVNGDSLYFPYYGSLNHASTNDIVGLTLSSVSAPQGGDFTFSGNPVVLTGGLSGPMSWNVPTTLAASQTFQGNSGLGGSIDLNGHTLTLDGVSYISGSLVGAGQLVLTGGRDFELSGSSSFTGTFSVSSLDLILFNGSITNSTLLLDSGATLSGIGVVPHTILTGSILQSSGVLSTGDLSLQGGSAVFEIRIDFLGTHATQVVTAGSVTLNNPTLTLTIPASLPLPGQSFVLIDNDGTDPVVGTFAGLPEGATFLAGVTPFRISYSGGDGNDVVVTALAGGPNSWTGAVSGQWSVGGNWSGGTAPVNGDVLYFPYYGSFNHTSTNDLVGLTLSSINVPQGGDFSFSGNPVVLTGGLTGGMVWNVPTTLGASQSFQGGNSYGSSIDLNGHTLTLVQAVGLDGSVVGSGQLVLTGGRDFYLTGTSSFTGTLSVSSLKLIVNGSVANSTLIVGSGATLSGTGVVPHTILTGGTLQSSGILSTGDLSLQGGSATFEIRIDFLGTHATQVVTAGSVTLDNPTLTLTVPASPPLPGQSFVLIDNDGSDPVVGAFVGLPEGATFLAGVIPFRISYVGGDGNDVVVTALPGGPSSWTGAVSDQWSVGGNWSGGSPPANGAALYFPYYGSVRHVSTNDIVGLTLSSILVPQGGDFAFSGNPVVLTGGIVRAPTWNIPTTLAASQTFQGVGLLGSSIDLNGHTLTLDGVGDVQGSIVGSGRVVVHGDFGLFGTSSFAGTFTVSSGNLNVRGAITNSTLIIDSGATLSGTGVVPHTVLNGARLQSSDTLSTGDLSLQGGSAVFDIRIDFLGTHTTKVVTAGSVTLHSPTLVLTIPASPPLPGQSFVLIDNHGPDPVVGAFAGLNEGATFLAGITPFRISYSGGDGNDVVVTALAQLPPTFTTSVPALDGRGLAALALLTALVGMRLLRR